MQVIPVPPNKPCIRRDTPLQVHLRAQDAEQERDSVVRTAIETGLPLLIGTDSTASSVEVHQSVLKVLKEYRDQHRIERVPSLPATAMMSVSRLPLPPTLRGCMQLGP